MVDQAEQDLGRCWETLASLRTGPDHRLVDFQIDLAAVLYRLSELYQEIAAERRALIGRKQSYSPRWFARRQAVLAGYQTAIERTLLIGKSMGNAFAWFFYQSQPDLLQKHYSEPHQRVLPTGIGGRGELEFIRQVRSIDGKLVLHHGITSILRVGDISLIDLSKFRVVSIGEIKTAPIVALKALGGGKVRFSFKREDDGDRVSMHPDSTGIAIYFRFAPIGAAPLPVPEPTPTPTPTPPPAPTAGVSGSTDNRSEARNADIAGLPTMTGYELEVSSRARYLRMVPMNRIGMVLHVFAQWINSSKPQNNGPYSMVATVVIG